MIAALILVISVVVLLQFFVSYCRSLIAASQGKELSEQGREIAGVKTGAIRGDEFSRLVQLVRLCPEPGDDRREIRAVEAYYGLLNLIRAALGRLAPDVASWAEQERAGCAHFAAVTLDHRIAYSRELMAQQMGDQL